MTDSLAEIQADLRQNLALYRGLLQVVEEENQALRQPEPGSLFQNFTARKRLLPELDQSLLRLRRHRATWSKLAPADRARQPDIGSLLRQCQDAIMKILMLDRENEQALLRRGLLGPRHLPSHNRQRPHLVADLYRRQGGS